MARPAKVLSALVLIGLTVALGSAPAADGRANPSRVRPARGLSPTLARSRGRIRVAVQVAGFPSQAASSPPAAGRLGPQALEALRSADGPLALRLAERSRRARALALRSVRANPSLPIARALFRLGARVETVDPISGQVFATVSASALPAISRMPEVQSVLPAPRDRRHGLDTSTATTGAPAFWFAGFLGGIGPADPVDANLAILDDKVDETHPAFSLRPDLFERPENTATAGDLHGTEVAGMAVSQGTTTCPAGYQCAGDDVAPAYRGVAFGVHRLLDAAPNGSYSAGAWALGIAQTDPLTDRVLPGARSVADVFSGSYGQYVPGEDDSPIRLNTDAAVSQYGVSYALSAGNDGPAQSVSSPCISYDTICTGGVDQGPTSDTADDRVADFSSRGPTPAGRKKPDLVAVAISEVVNVDWRTAHHIWRADSGTSFAAPQAAGAATLLAGSGITDPLAQKAILIDSARSGRKTAAAPMGTQTGWQPDWGWGELDLVAALGQRTNFYTDGVPGGGVRFYASTAQPGDRATLVWNRRVTSCLVAGCTTPQAMTLSDLDLLQLDAATGATLTSSASQIDNVEQARSPIASSGVVYKVKARSSVDGLPREPFALAARRQVYPLANPQPEISVTLSRALARPGQTLTARAVVTNTSPDLTGEGASATLRLPPGYRLAPGSPPATVSLGTLAKNGSPGSSAQPEWTVIAGGADGVGKLEVAATTHRYGETFVGAQDESVRVDATPPHASLSARRLSGPPLIRVRWGARDSGAGVRAYDVLVAAPRHRARVLLRGTRRTVLTFRGRARHSYRFLVRASDRAGNLSPFARTRYVFLKGPR